MRYIDPQRIKTLLAIFYDSTRLSSLLRKGKSIILMYHRVIDDAPSQVIMQPGMYVTKSTFEMHIKYLKDHFELVSLDNILTNQHNQVDQHNYQATCAITFDDGWRDNYTNALPILKKYKVPATIFLSINFIGTNDWFWPEKVYYLLQKSTEPERCCNSEVKYLLSQKMGIHISKNNADLISLGNKIVDRIKSFPSTYIEDFIVEWGGFLNDTFPQKRLFLNWAEIKDMSRHGMTFGSHTMSHRILTGLPKKEKESEIEESFEVLKEAKINLTPIFSYPNGDYDRETLDTIRYSRYRGAVTTLYGINNSHTDPFRLKRIGIHEDISRTRNLFSFRITNACIPIKFLRI